MTKFVSAHCVNNKNQYKKKGTRCSHNFIAFAHSTNSNNRSFVLTLLQCTTQTEININQQRVCTNISRSLLNTFHSCLWDGVT